MKVEIQPESRGLLRVEAKCTRRENFEDYFDLELLFEFHSGVAGDVIVVRNLKKADLALIGQGVSAPGVPAMFKG